MALWRHELDEVCGPEDSMEQFFCLFTLCHLKLNLILINVTRLKNQTGQKGL